MKKVALLTTFFEAQSGYSLVSVAETQIQALLSRGYEPAVLVQAAEDPSNPDPDIPPEAVEKREFLKEFRVPDAPSLWRPEIVDLRPIVPALRLDSGVSENFKERAQRIHDALCIGLEDAEVCITHDIILQDWFKEHNVAMRRYAKERPDLLWLHWIHSCPTPGRNLTHPHDSRCTPPPGYIVYPNDFDKPRVCSTYGLEQQEWRVVVCRFGHSIDPLTLWPYDKLTKELATNADLFGGEVVAVYPVRLDRGKQPEKIIRLMAGVQAADYEPRLLVIDWQSSGKRFQKYIDELLELADTLGLSGKVNFTSRLDDRCSQGVPRHIVTELMDLSNVYVHPSKVETYSLVVHEAMLRGCLCVLNFDFPVMQELFGSNAIYMDFSSDRVDRTYQPDEQTFWNDEALRLLAELRQNRAATAKTTARREWNPDALWKEFEPLLHLPAVGV